MLFCIYDFCTGETKHYPNRTFLLYDGIHYDPLGLQDNDQIVQTCFPTDEPRFQSEVLALAENLKKVIEIYRYYFHLIQNYISLINIFKKSYENNHEWVSLKLITIFKRIL